MAKLAAGMLPSFLILNKISMKKEIKKNQLAALSNFTIAKKELKQIKGGDDIIITDIIMD